MMLLSIHYKNVAFVILTQQRDMAVNLSSKKPSECCEARGPLDNYQSVAK